LILAFAVFDPVFLPAALCWWALKNKKIIIIITTPGRNYSMMGFRSWLKGAVVLEILLGLTWSFGLAYVSEQTVAFAYVFTLLNTLQGTFIFVFHCVLNEKVTRPSCRPPAIFASQVYTGWVKKVTC